jgi:uncharacterized protein YoxC
VASSSVREKPYLFEVTTSSGLSTVWSARDAATRDGFSSALQSALSTTSPAFMKDVAAAAAHNLQDDVVSTVASLFPSTGEVGGVFEAGQAVVDSVESAGSRALEMANAFVPGLLGVAREIPVFGPIAGVLLKCHQCFARMTANKEALSGLQDQLVFAGRLIKQVAERRELFTGEGCAGLEGVVEAMKGLAIAANNATLVINRLEAREKRRISGAIASLALSGADEALIASTVTSLASATNNFCQVLGAYTGMQTLSTLRGVADEVHHVAEGMHHVADEVHDMRSEVHHVAEEMHRMLTMFDATTRTRKQEALRRARLTDIEHITSRSEFDIFAGRCIPVAPSVDGSIPGIGPLSGSAIYIRDRGV